jgi:gamma-glutamyltranspeptidase
MVFDPSGQLRYVVGAPGGTAINLAILQVLLNVLDFKMPIDRAISAPRFVANSSLVRAWQLEGGKMLAFAHPDSTDS